MGLFGLWRDARTRRLALKHPVPDELWDWAIGEHRILNALSQEDKSALRSLVSAFLAVKRFVPVKGAEADRHVQVSVAAQACLPLLGLDLSWYRNFTTIYLTPKPYAVTQRYADEAGVVHEYEDEFAGEAFDLGPVALSIEDIEASGWGDGYNTVIHEMAHKLDALDGALDGCPALRPGMDRAAWVSAFARAFESLNAALEAPRKRKKLGRSPSPRGSRIDPYAAENPAEFFAVVCEYFWERPRLLASEFPEVYGQLKRFFGRDPSAWLSG